MENQTKGISLRKRKFLLRDSDRSGFTYRNVELVLDNGSLVGGEEFDAPPPSNRLYSSEGEVSPGDTRSDYTDYSQQIATEVQYLTTASTISVSHQVDNAGQYTYIKSVVFITGSCGSMALETNPQIAPSNHGDFLTVQGVGSSVILRNGSGLRLYTTVFRIDSGTQLNLIYNATDSLWCETSRMYQTFSLSGEF